ncbi:MAG: hypothetical protein LBU90_04785 [Bacteroidales bacterium]|jgi:hypothetical protein|nr:hypothetical protein [Bacteroidales bacterium]
MAKTEEKELTEEQIARNKIKMAQRNLYGQIAFAVVNMVVVFSVSDSAGVLYYLSLLALVYLIAGPIIIAGFAKRLRFRTYGETTTGTVYDVSENTEKTIDANKEETTRVVGYTSYFTYHVNGKEYRIESAGFSTVGNTMTIRYLREKPEKGIVDSGIESNKFLRTWLWSGILITFIGIVLLGYVLYRIMS